MEAISEQLKSEEETIIRNLNGCRTSRVMFHTVTYALPLYVAIEMPLIEKYEAPSFLHPEPKKSKRREHPTFEETVHTYKHLDKTIYVDIHESNRRYHDADHIPYHLLTVNFRSGSHHIVTDSDIRHFLEQFSRYYHGRLRQIGNEIAKGIITDHSVRRIPTGLQWELFYLEPCVDITGPTESVDFLHKSLRDNLHMTRCKHRDQRGGDSKGKKHTRDGRLLRDENPTYYISDKFRGYRYERKNAHTLRVELQFDRLFLGSEGQKHPAQVWNDRYFFFILNIPKIIKRVEKRYPSEVDIIKAVLSDDNLTAWKKYEFIRDYGKVKKKRVRRKKGGIKQPKKKEKTTGLFRSSREFLTPKWLTLHKFIGDAFLNISVKYDFTESMIPEPVFPQPTSKKDKTDKKIEEAIARLKQKGIKDTWENIQKESGVSTYSLGRYFTEKKGSIPPL